MTTEKKRTVRSNYEPECTVLFLIGFHQRGERCVVLQEVSEPREPHRRQGALRKRETGEPPSVHERQAPVRVLPNKVAALQMG